MKPFYLFLLSASLFFTACQSDSKPHQDKIVLPNVPSEVAKQWVEAFYNDDFVKAAELGTMTTQMMIDSVKKEMEPDATLIAFKISNMACQVQGDSALCTYVYEEDLDKYEEYVELLKVKGQWLVDESWDASSSAEQEFDMIREEVEKLMLEESLNQKE